MHFLLVFQDFSQKDCESYEEKHHQQCCQVHGGDIHINIEQQERHRTDITCICEILTEILVCPREVCKHKSLTKLHELHVRGKKKKSADFETKDVRDDVARVQRLRNSL